MWKEDKSHSATLLYLYYRDSVGNSCRLHWLRFKISNLFCFLSWKFYKQTKNPNLSWESWSLRLRVALRPIYLTTWKWDNLFKLAMEWTASGDVQAHFIPLISFQSPEKMPRQLQQMGHCTVRREPQAELEAHSAQAKPGFPSHLSRTLTHSTRASVSWECRVARTWLDRNQNPHTLDHPLSLK